MITDLIPEHYHPLILETLKISFPALLTFFITKYTLKKPRKYEILSAQFDLIYSPLYLLTLQYLSAEPSNLSLYIKKVDKLLYKNYKYVYPKTLRLFNLLKESFLNGRDSDLAKTNFEYQVRYDYEYLKRKLGYPSNSLIDIFSRLNRIDRCFLFVHFLFVSVALYSGASAVALIYSGDFLNGFSALGVSAITGFFSYLIKGFRY